MTTYALADTKTQWFADDFPGVRFEPNCGVLHTTESTGWPGYDGGAKAPNYTAQPDFTAKRLAWRAHFPDEMSSRALRNLAGGVETNTLNAVQVELVGTCAPATRDAWIKSGMQQDQDFIYWPEAPEWALRDLAAFIIDMQKRHGILIQGPEVMVSVWMAYPASFGVDNPNRFTFAQWRAFLGWCGHQHVPENAHGDPGALPWAKVVEYTQDRQISHRHASANIKSNPLMPLGDAAADIIQVAGHAGVIGWQEIHKLYRPTIRTMPGFTTYWPGRRFSRDANAVPISWRTAHFELVASGVMRTHFGRPRVTPARYIAWVVLRDLRTGQVFWRVNTHYISAAWSDHRERRPLWEKHDRKLGSIVLRLFWEHGPNGVVGGDFNRDIGSGRLNGMLHSHSGQHEGHHYDHLYAFGGDTGPMTRLPLNSDHDGIVTRITFKESS